jgi:hypothetical protein
MTSFSNLIQKIKARIWSEILAFSRRKNFYYKIYPSYWHSLMHKPKPNNLGLNYFSAIPNRGAGIGHQLANWIAGYWFANQFNLRFAHFPLSTEKWEKFMGFGDGEIMAKDLIYNQGFRKVNLPKFDEGNTKEVSSIKKIIASYNDQKIVFIAEQDQSYFDQFGVMEEIKQKFHCAKARQTDQLIYTKENFNIAIHIRRGDIVVGKKSNNKNLIMRWQDVAYFEKILSTVIENIKTNKPIAIYLFSQGLQDDFPEFNKFDNIQFCTEMSAQDSFLHMVFADLLITSKSSFSYKPALLSKGIKVCPKNFWHGYPVAFDWVLAEENGTLGTESLMKLKTTIEIYA